MLSQSRRYLTLADGCSLRSVHADVLAFHDCAAVAARLAQVDGTVLPQRVQEDEVRTVGREQLIHEARERLSRVSL